MRGFRGGWIVVAAALAVLAAGCGGSPGAGASSGAAGTTERAPILGEDAMKAEMEKVLQKKGRLPKGLGLPSGSGANKGH